jgi:hypothetical protein
MLITFQSQASGDVMMFGDVAKQMLRIMGKEPADKGIITAVQLPDAIAALTEAIAADKAAWSERSAAGRGGTDAAQEDGGELFVSASHRARPLLELLERSLTADKPVLWAP